MIRRPLPVFVLATALLVGMWAATSSASQIVGRPLQQSVELAELIVIAEAIDREDGRGGRELVLRIERVVADRTGEGYMAGDEVVIDRGVWPAGQSNLSIYAESLVRDRRFIGSSFPSYWHPRYFESGVRYLALLRRSEEGSFVSALTSRLVVSAPPTHLLGDPGAETALWLQVTDWWFGGLRWPVDFRLELACDPRSGQTETFTAWFRLADFEELVNTSEELTHQMRPFESAPCAAATPETTAVTPAATSPIRMGDLEWMPRTGQWSVDDDVISGAATFPRRELFTSPGRGQTRQWGFLELMQPVPASVDWAVSADVLVEDGVGEIVLGACEEDYTRVYVYPLGGLVVIGAGQFDEDGHVEGGPTLHRINVDGLSTDSWHHLEARVLDDRLVVSYDGEVALDVTATANLRDCPRLGLATGDAAQWRDVRVGPAGDQR